MKIFDGQDFAASILRDLKKDVQQLKEKPTLAVVSFDEKQSSFIKKKRETANFLGVGFKEYLLDSSLGTKGVREKLNQIVKQKDITSVVVQLPLPENINSSVLNIIPPEKDPDVLSDKATELFSNNRSLVAPPTATAILAILEKESVKIKNVKITVFGYGKLVGKFLVNMLTSLNGRVSVIDREVSYGELKEAVIGSKIIISAVGSAHFLPGKILPENSVVIDSGFSTLDPALVDKGGVDGGIAGDIDFGQATNKLALAVMVPGGVGPVGVAMLFKNVIKLFNLKIKEHAS